MTVLAIRPKALVQVPGIREAGAGIPSSPQGLAGRPDRARAGLSSQSRQVRANGTRTALMTLHALTPIFGRTPRIRPRRTTNHLGQKRFYVAPTARFRGVLDQNSRFVIPFAVLVSAPSASEEITTWETCTGQAPHRISRIAAAIFMVKIFALTYQRADKTSFFCTDGQNGRHANPLNGKSDQAKDIKTQAVPNILERFPRLSTAIAATHREASPQAARLPHAAMDLRCESLHGGNQANFHPCDRRNFHLSRRQERSPLAGKCKSPPASLRRRR